MAFRESWRQKLGNPSVHVGLPRLGATEAPFSQTPFANSVLAASI